MSTPTGRPLRADAERSMRAIMTAAERLLSENPAATMEQIAEAAGVARVTIHRRFASREALIAAMEAVAWREIDAAVDAARPHSAPPLVALHQATANILQIKDGRCFTLTRPVPLGAEARALQADAIAKCEMVFVRAKEAGIIRPDADVAWVRRAYLALLTDIAHGSPPGADPDVLSAQLINTLMYGVATR